MLFRPLCLLTVALFISPLQSPTQAAQSEEDLRASLKKFTQVYEVVEGNFADKIDSDQIYKGAIPAMLRTLDPHSNFFDPKANELFREQQQGRYFGVGMYIFAPEGKVMVSYPFINSPAWKAGLHPADTIISVNDKNTEKLGVGDVSAMLKGPRGTPAQVVVKRIGETKPLTFDIIRDQVPRDSVTDAYWYRPGIAFVKIDAFKENTSKELDQALTKLGESKMEGLILDLRDNPGGLVNEAVGVADHFLHKGQGIVSHHGRSSAETKFAAKHGERGPEYPIVVLVNRGSASAAEILTGALQDHDRAWVLGENTFGKGLVQAPFPLTGDSTLLLTIAKYYTPSGRLIQRDYEHQSFYEYYSRGEGHVNLKDAKKTDSGRIVYGGDGIAPDEHYEVPKFTRLEAEIEGRTIGFFYAPNFFAAHKTPLTRDWTPDAATMEDFKQFAMKRGMTIDQADWDRDKPWLEEYVREQLFITAFSKEDSDRVALDHDPEIQKAIEALPQSKALLEKAKAIIARQSHEPAAAIVR
jgi:carboxyl-terminal processing protease